MNSKLVLALMLVFSLTACGNGDVKSALGLKKSAPDEFRVISNPPLSVPPEFQMAKPENSDNSFISHLENRSVERSASSEDNNFLRKFSSDEQNSSVKDMIEKEYHQEQTSLNQKGVIRKTFSKLNDKKDPTVNPIAEKKRITENIAAGKAVNEGDIKIRKKSTLERIFN